VALEVVVLAVELNVVLEDVEARLEEDEDVVVACVVETLDV